MIKKILISTPVILYRLLYALLGIVVIGGCAYFFANFYLREIGGTDSVYALNLIHWIDKYFPKIPFWYHLQGAGVSMLWSYPYLASILVVLLSKISHIGILASYQVMIFSSVLLTALGMYLFVWWRLKNQTAGLIASVFYIITPLAYAYFADWGFFAEAISCIFFFPTLMFYDLFLEGVLAGKLKASHRLGLLLTVVFAALLFNTHPNTFFSLLFVIGFQTIIRSGMLLVKNLRQEKKKRKRTLLKDTFFKAFFPSILFLILTVFLAAFMILNFTYYERVRSDIAVSDENIVNIKAGNLEYFTLHHSLPLKSFLGLEILSPEHYLFPLRNISIIPLVWILALLGIVLSLFCDRKVFAYIFPAIFGFGILTYPAIFFGPIRILVKLHFPGIAYFLNQRIYLTMVRKLFPIAAAFGIVGFGQLLFEILTFWRRWVKNKIVSFGLSSTRVVFVAVFSICAFLFLLYYSADKPEGLYEWFQIKYGFEAIDMRNPFGKFNIVNSNPGITNELAYLRGGCVTLQDDGFLPPVCAQLDPKENIKKDMLVLEKFANKCQKSTVVSSEIELCPLVLGNKRNKKDLYKATYKVLKDFDNWNKPFLLKPDGFQEQVFPFPEMMDFVNKTAGENNLRVDVSPSAGGVVMGLNSVSNMSMISLYAYTASLIGPYWGHAQQVLFQVNDGREETATEIAKWFGTKYLLFNFLVDPIDKYFQKGEWEVEFKETDRKDENGKLMVLKLINFPEMATWTQDKPTVLVIGNKKRRVFEPIFRASNKGALPYDDFWLVEGEERIDSYSLDELLKFDILYLYGYDYKSKNKAWNLIDSYLNAGGKVFLSTGWQYVDRDWETSKTPDWFPASSLLWSEQFSKGNKYSFDLKAMGGKLDISKFGPLEQDGLAYGVSSAKNLRDWAKPVLSVNGTPLVAVGNYGKGKIVWSGLNLIGHMHSFAYNDSELGFHKVLFDWLKGDQKGEDLSKSVVINRDYPDKVSFVFQKSVDGPSALYWRESAFPNWKAKLISGKNKQKVKIYYGGPRLMFMHLSNIEAGDTLVLEFEPGIRHYLLLVLSALTGLLLLIYFVLGNKMFKPLAKVYKNIFKKKIKSFAKKRMKKIQASEEEDY